MTDDESHKAEPDYVQYQQNEIDGAKEHIKERRDHLGDYHADGLLDGDFVNHRDNTQFKAYLQGYADALEYASGRVDSIDNLVKYAVEAEEQHGEDADDD